MAVTVVNKDTKLKPIINSDITQRGFHEIVPDLYRNYGDYVCKRKMFPNMIDGLIPIWRRILLGSHVLSRNEFKKTVQVVGHIIGHWHPHSDSIEDTIAKLIHNKFLIGKGNWGMTGCVVEKMDCAAPRYTGIKSKPEIEELAFKYIKDVPWEPDELDPEPVVLPTMIPFCLFTQQRVDLMGFGFKTVIPNYHLKDLIKRLLFLLGKRKRITIKPNIIGCQILSDNKVLEDLLSKKGKHKIDLTGTYTVDRPNHSIALHGWAPGTTFDNIFKRIDSFNKLGLISSGSVGYIDENEIRLEVNRSRGKDDIFKNLLKAVKDRLLSSITFDIHVINPAGDVYNATVDEMLLTTYKFYTNVTEKNIKRQLSELDVTINELNIIAKIKPHLPEVLKIKDIEKTIQRLHELSGVAIKLIKEVIDKHKIRKLLTVNTDISDLKAKVKTLNNRLRNIEGYVIGEYETLMKSLK